MDIVSSRLTKSLYKKSPFQVSKDLMTGPGEDLFDFMAVKLELFMLDNDLLTDEESGMLFPTSWL